MEDKPLEQSSDQQKQLQQSHLQQTPYDQINQQTPYQKQYKLSQLLKSKYKSQYESHFINIKTLSLNQIQLKYGQKFIKNLIQFNPNKYQKKVCINRKDSTINSQIMVYNVIIGYFKLNVSLINLDFPFINDSSLQFLGGGSYGNIYVMNVNNKKYACKNVMYQQDQNYTGNQQLKVYSTLIQYCISKICSVLQVGPSIQRALGFDLICYSNCIQFFMEQAKPLLTINQTTKQQLLYQLSLIHSIKLIHNDIKPQNILYSSAFNHPIFIDFGISQFIQQQLGTLSKVAFRGSYNYGTAQMKQLFNQKKISSYVDLYFNDLNGLLITLKQLQNHQSIDIGVNLTNYCKNEQQYWTQFHIQNKLIKTTSSQSITFIINLLLMVYSLYTRYFHNQINMPNILSKLSNHQEFYHQLAQFIAQIPPNPFVYDFFKVYIKPFLIEKGQDNHITFSIYKDNYFVPWLKQNNKKSAKFQSRLVQVQYYLNYHLNMLGKPASINKFFAGWNQTKQYKQRMCYFMCYLDHMTRNVLKGKQYLIKLMYKNIYQKLQYKHQQQIPSPLQNIKQNPYKLQAIGHLTIQYQHYMNLCFIYNTFPKQQITEFQNIWIICKILQEFVRLNDYKKVIIIYDFISSQKIIKQFKAQWFKQTFDIFAMFQRNTDLQMISLMRIKLQQMIQLRQQIASQTYNYQRYDLFFTQILIKISIFFLKISQYYRSINKSQKLKQLQLLYIQIQKEYNSRRKYECINDQNTLKLKIQQMKFSIVFLKGQTYQILKYGQQIIIQNDTIDNPRIQKNISKNLTNIIAQIYLDVGNIKKAKKYLYRNVSLQICYNFYSQYKQQLLRFKINLIQNNIQQSKKNMIKLKILLLNYKISSNSYLLSSKVNQLSTNSNILSTSLNQQNKSQENNQLINWNKKIQFMQELIKFYIKYVDIFPSDECKQIIQVELQNLFIGIEGYPIHTRQNIYKYKIVIGIGKDDYDTINKKIINYRRCAAQLVLLNMKQNSPNLTVQQINQAQLSFNRFYENINNLGYYPQQRYLHLFQQTFFTIHAKYHQLYSSSSQLQTIFLISTKLYSYQQSIYSLQLWLSYYRYKINKPSNITPSLINQLNTIINYIFQSNKQIFFIKKRWHQVVFDYDSKLQSTSQSKFILSLNILIKISIFIHKSQHKNLITNYYSICLLFVQYIKTKQQLHLFHSLLVKQLNKTPQLSILLYTIYNILVILYPQQQTYDSLLSSILLSYHKLCYKGQQIILKKIYLFLYDRYNLIIQNIIKYPNLQKINILNKTLTIKQIYQKHQFYLKKHIRNPHSSFDNQRQKNILRGNQIFNTNYYQFTNPQSNQQSYNINYNTKAILISQKINKKLKKYFLNKHTQIHIYRQQNSNSSQNSL